MKNIVPEILRNKRIDFLRGIAILLVLILHFNLSYHLDQSALTKIFSVHFIHALVFNGNYGVTMFFVISGFLITSISLERYKELGNIDVIGFYIQRFSRIMPCLLLALALIVFFNFINIPIFKNTANTTSMFIAIFSVLTFWHNVLMQKLGYFNYCLNIYWSLSVEEIFYLVFPMACLLFKKLRLIVLFWLALIIIGPIYRSFYVDNEIVALYAYFSCFDAIAIGCCAAIIAPRILLSGWFANVIQCGAVLFVGSIYLYAGIMDNVMIGVSLLAIGTAIFLIGASQKKLDQPKQSQLFSKAICWFGSNSYELYLFHIIVLAVMKEIYRPESLGDYSKLLWMVLFFGISAFFAGVLSKYYSQPLNKKLRAFFFDLRHQKILAGTDIRKV
jgi:peptidoglycan/LPS O-acetylase OafA/YrhL